MNCIYCDNFSNKHITCKECNNSFCDRCKYKHYHYCDACDEKYCCDYNTIYFSEFDISKEPIYSVGYIYCQNCFELKNEIEKKACMGVIKSN